MSTGSAARDERAAATNGRGSTRTRARLAALALLLLAGWEIAALRRAHATAPSGDDWARASAAVHTGFAPGDLVVFAPGWMDPVGRQYLGDLLTVRDAARMDAARYARIWEVSTRGAAAPEAEGPIGFDESYGALHVRRVDHTAERISWDLRARSQLFEVDYQPRWCVEVRAPGRLDLGSVALDGRLVVYAGLSDFRTRRDNRAFAFVRVLIDDTEAARGRIGSETGWVRLPEISPRSGMHRVVLQTEVDPEAPGPPAILPVCIAAEVRS